MPSEVGNFLLRTVHSMKIYEETEVKGSLILFEVKERSQKLFTKSCKLKS